MVIAAGYSISGIDLDFECTGKSAVDTGNGLLRRRLYKEVSLFYGGKVYYIYKSVSEVQCKSVRIAAVKIVLSNRAILVFSVYLYAYRGG